MKQSKHTGGTLGGLGLPIGIPAPEFEGVPEAVRPFFAIGMKMQSEFLELCGHRCCAWLDWPEKSCTCKTVEDLTTVQSEYLSKMQRDYAHFLDGILRDTMIEQDEYEEDRSDPEAKQEEAANPLHREAPYSSRANPACAEASRVF